MLRVICSKKRFISAQSHCLTHAQFIKSLGEVRIVVRLGSVKLRDLVGYFHFLRSLITAIQCLKPLLPLRLMTKIPNGGTNREEGR